MCLGVAEDRIIFLNLSLLVGGGFLNILEAFDYHILHCPQRCPLSPEKSILFRRS